MPPKKAPKLPPPGNIRALFAQGSRAEASEVLESQATATMALTKSDLIETLAIFKVELRGELKTDLLAEFQTFRSEFNDKLSGLRTDVDSVGTRVLDMENHAQEQGECMARHIAEIQTVKDQLELTLLKTEDLENRLRRDNLRIRGLK